MTPSFTLQGFAHSGIGDPVFSAEGYRCHPVPLMSEARLSNDILGQLGIAVSRTSYVSVLLSAIAHIIGGGSKKQMIGINARRIVALVQYPEIVRDRAISYFVGYAMGEQRTGSLAACVNLSIARSGCAAYPRNTSPLRRRTKMSLETYLKWYGLPDMLTAYRAKSALALPKCADLNVERTAASLAGSRDSRRDSRASALAGNRTCRPLVLRGKMAPQTARDIVHKFVVSFSRPLVESP